MKLELVESRLFKVPKSRIRKLANNVGLPEDINLSVAERAENSISDDAADDENNSDNNTLDSGNLIQS